MIRNGADILALGAGAQKTLVVAAAEEEEVLSAIKIARDRGIITPILVGDPKAIRAIADEINFDIKGIEIVPAIGPETAVAAAAQLIAEERGHVLMKGNVNSSIFLKAILSRKYGLRGEGLLSHVAIFFPPGYHKPILVTDAAINLFPSIEEKASIIRNSVGVLQKTGVERPKVAILAHNEIPSPKVPASLDAIRLKEMVVAGKIRGCILDGPMALDCALNKEACRHKNLISEVGGDADILFCPDILSGNILYKAMVFLAGAHSAAIISGARVPIVMTSRSEDSESKILSIAFAAGVH